MAAIVIASRGAGAPSCTSICMIGVTIESSRIDHRWQLKSSQTGKSESEQHCSHHSYNQQHCSHHSYNSWRVLAPRRPRAAGFFHAKLWRKGLTCRGCPRSVTRYYSAVSGIPPTNAPADPSEPRRPCRRGFLSPWLHGTGPSLNAFQDLQGRRVPIGHDTRRNKAVFPISRFDQRNGSRAFVVSAPRLTIITSTKPRRPAAGFLHFCSMARQFCAKMRIVPGSPERRPSGLFLFGRSPSVRSGYFFYGRLGSRLRSTGGRGDSPRVATPGPGARPPQYRAPGRLPRTLL
jgi:hypothetical protein